MKRKKKIARKKAGGKKLLERAGMAIMHEFYLEASWILSSMIERKLGKIHEKLEQGSYRKGLGFSQAIKRVKHLQVNSNQTEMTVKLNVGLIDQIRNWKNQRNGIMKDILTIHVSQKRLERLANEGVKLYKELNKEAKSLKSGGVRPELAR